MSQAPPPVDGPGDVLGDDPERAVLQWVERVVVGLDLCPFAGHSLQCNVVRTVIADGDVEAVLTVIAQELERLVRQDPASGATTLVLVCGPDGRSALAADFDDYLDLLAMAEDLAESLGYSGRVQLASFHPDYIFADAVADDPANLSNRSPVPLVHLLLEDAVTAAVAHHPDPEGIPEQNVARLRELGAENIKRVAQGESQK